MWKNLIKNYKEYKAPIVTVITLIVILLPVVIVVNHIMDIATKMKAYSYVGADVAYKNTISISGEGRVYTKPDIAMINLSVVTEGKKITSAQEENSKKMNSVINFLKGFGVEEKDIKTTNYRLYPRYNYEDRRIPQIIGYEITQTLEIKIRNLEKIGEILEQSVGVGINQISSLRFAVDNDKELKEEARNLAIADAKEKAKKLASQLGIRLIKISGFDEGTGFDYPIYRELGMGGAAEKPQIQIGENEIVVNATLIYEID
jgi:uncharacterized protein YggE